MNTTLDFLIELLSANVWQLLVLFFGLLILKQVKDDIRPIFGAMVNPLTKQAQTNAATWALAIMLAVLSMIGAIKEVADSLHWLWLGYACKILNAPLALLVGLIKQSQTIAGPAAPTGATTPPFPSPAAAQPPPPAGS